MEDRSVEAALALKLRHGVTGDVADLLERSAQRLRLGPALLVIAVTASDHSLRLAFVASLTAVFTCRRAWAPRRPRVELAMLFAPLNQMLKNGFFFNHGLRTQGFLICCNRPSLEAMRHRPVEPVSRASGEADQVGKGRSRAPDFCCRQPWKGFQPAFPLTRWKSVSSETGLTR